MKAVPLEFKQANAFIDNLHRHHDPVYRDKFRFGCEDGGQARWCLPVCQTCQPYAG